LARRDACYAAALVMRTIAAGWVFASALALGCTGGGNEDDEAGTGAGTASEAEGPGTEATAGSTGGSEGADTAGTAATTVDTADDLPDCPMMTYYPDEDMDGYGDQAYPVDACIMPPAHIPTGGDCDDTNMMVHPGIEEVCDTFDNDCNGLVDEASATNTSCQGCGLGLMGDHAYSYCPGPVAFADARTTCMGFGGDLVVIDDQAEQDFLLGQPVTAGPNYIGLSDEAVEGTFVWVDGSALGFTVWNTGEPNNALEGEDCAQLAVPEGLWNDIACATGSAFICEAIAVDVGASD
jgi:hypothetical protein